MKFSTAFSLAAGLVAVALNTPARADMPTETVSLNVSPAFVSALKSELSELRRSLVDQFSIAGPGSLPVIHVENDGTPSKLCLRLDPVIGALAHAMPDLIDVDALRFDQAAVFPRGSVSQLMNAGVDLQNYCLDAQEAAAPGSDSPAARQRIERELDAMEATVTTLLVRSKSIRPTAVDTNAREPKVVSDARSPATPTPSSPQQSAIRSAQ